jgi:hypothetical protein
MITIGYSTRKTNPKFQEYLRKSCGYPKVQIIEKVNNGEKSLTQVYNEILNESNNNIIVFCHDDIEFDTSNWSKKLLRHFERNPEYGILGVAGSKYMPLTGKWWEIPHTMYGVVNHKHEGKKWTNTYSKPLQKIDNTVVVDGLFFAINKNKIKKTFDESYNGFHFYDISFCFSNYVGGVKIGVINDIRITHLSIGMTNEQWEKNRIKFVNDYRSHLPANVINKNNVETFIFCHDQDIIIQYEESNKFSELSNYTYVFLGSRDCEKIRDYKNVIISRELPINIEHYKELCSFTGWYSLWKNGYIKSDYINLFEYDVILVNEFEQIMSKIIYEKPNMVGYIPFPCNNYHFIDNQNWVDTLFKGIKTIYNVDFEKTLRLMIQKDNNLYWSSTSNSTMSKSFFESYMKWFEPMIDIVAESKTAGGGHERSISFFYFWGKTPIILTQGLLKHYQMDSHKHQGHFVDYEKNINQLVNNTL